MNVLAGVRARVLGAVRTVVQGDAPVSSRSAEPGPPDLGTLAVIRPFGPIKTLPSLPARWASETGVSGRLLHQHGWFAEYAHAYATGDAEAGKMAISTMESWLRQDRPGSGLAWEHASDCALRLIHWHAGLSWLGEAASPALRADLAGSAQWHLDHLRTRLPWGAHFGSRRVAHQVGRLVGGLTFPGLPPARESWSEAVSSLTAELEEFIFPDGSPRSGALPFAVHTAWFGVLGAAVARANGVALPGRAKSALSQLVYFISRVAGDNGTIPAAGESIPAFALDFGDYPLPWSLWNMALAVALVEGEPAPDADRDPRRAWFFTGSTPAREAPKAAWAMSSFAEDGWVIANCRVRNESLRVVSHACHASSGPFANPFPSSLWVDLGNVPVVCGEANNTLCVTGASGTRGRLAVARVDGKKARIETTTDLGNTRVWERDVLLNQQRIFVTDRLTQRGRVSLRWTFGRAWQLEGDLPSIKLQHGSSQLAVQLPASLVWRVDGASVVGEGVLEAGGEVVTSFEFR